jgi:hypothetical protein
MKSNYFFHFFLFLLGFCIGNLFPTFFGQLIGSMTSFLLLFLFEILHGWLAVRHGRQTALRSRRRSLLPGREALYGRGVAGRSHPYPAEPAAKHCRARSTLLNSIKIGILFGLFVDAFKVGS